MWLFSIPKFDYNELQKEQIGQFNARRKMSTKDLIELKMEEQNGRDPLRQQQINELFKLANLNNPEANYKFGEDAKAESPIEETETIFWDEETEEIVITVKTTEEIVEENKNENIAELPKGMNLNVWFTIIEQYGYPINLSPPNFQYKNNYPNDPETQWNIGSHYYLPIYIFKDGLSLKRYKYNANITPPLYGTKDISYIIGIWDEETNDWLKYYSFQSGLLRPFTWVYKQDSINIIFNWMPTEENHSGYMGDGNVQDFAQWWNGESWVKYPIEAYARWYNNSFFRKPDFRLSFPEKPAKKKRASIDERKIKRRIRRKKERKKMRNCCSCASIAAMFARKHAEDIKMYRNLIKVIRSTAQEEIEIHAQQLEEINSIDFSAGLTGKRLWLGDKNLANDKE